LENLRRYICKGAPPVSATLVANLPPVPTILFLFFATGVVDIGGKFAIGVNDNSGKFASSVNDTGGKKREQYQAAYTLT
jgi:hypothetical protein